MMKHKHCKRTISLRLYQLSVELSQRYGDEVATEVNVMRTVSEQLSARFAAERNAVYEEAEQHDD